ncbi:pilus motility taxis protein HmpF [Mastigocoleus sp. MO_188.B34]|uniref:pilus motility taxis protein HmpF n=1 Tax=Mastigocoleus sp. MO_188.B34 TaxID=3036635 RepID=UPI002627D696|nr:pilus motility taxis protein HmpF [Mastigocoleus sp. MO_188.B34]MDJ0696628.1 pilus motility taxis protein HmpF [Mastigocoleus sp. MO_188.B34]
MLYLAEVQKQKGGLLGSSSKTGLKLLACQRKDQSWTTVSEETIGAEEASKLNDGVLVLVEINSSHQVQRIQEAGHPLVNILQNFSRQLEKFKNKEQEIDQWKESLTFQAQEFNRREMEMETRLEELQHLEEKQQQFDAQHEEIQNLQAEIERNREELEGAWEHLRGEQRLIEEYKSGIKQQPVLDRDKSQLLADLLERMSNPSTPTEELGSCLQQAFEIIDNQQAVLNPYLEQLEQQHNEINISQTEVDELSQKLTEYQNQWEQVKNNLDNKRSQLQIETAILDSKQEKVQILKEQLQRSEELHKQLEPLAIPGNTLFSGDIDVKALENMSLEELQQKVKELEDKLKIDSSFVEEQEHELNYKQETITELEQKIAQAKDEERSGLETELQDEKDSYQMLNETLVGQRRSLSERQSLLEGHQIVLDRRQGNTNGNDTTDNTVDLTPILSELKVQQQQHSEDIRNLESEIEQILSSIKEVENVVDSLTQEQESKGQEIQTIKENLLSLRTKTAESSGKLNIFQEVLLPIQDYLNNLREQLQGIANTLGESQELEDAKLQAIAEMRQIIDSLLVEPELVAS